MDGEIISSRIKATENTTLAKLTIFDQIKMLLGRFNNDEVAELKAQEKLSIHALTMQASLEKLIRKSAENIDGVKHNSVTISVSSKYIPYMDDVIDEKKGLGRFYKFTVHKQNLPINVDYMFTMRVERKVT